jgi:4-amino-4-deoxychorismate lyase
VIDPPPATLVVVDRPMRGMPADGPDDVGYRLVDPDHATIHVTDLGVTRGDGVFEGLGIADLDVFRAACLASAAAHEPAPFLLQKLVVTRGLEGGDGTPTAWVRTALMDDPAIERRDGISVVSLDRGYRHDVARTSPWLLQGAKTLSYAVNKSVLREAARRGADDVLFVSSDGYALEGPSASLLARFGDRYATPRLDQGILAGTTQAAAFDALEQQGVSVEYALLTLERVREADALWLVSSGRQIAPVTTLDGVAVPVDAAETERLGEALVGRRR